MHVEREEVDRYRMQQKEGKLLQGERGENNIASRNHLFCGGRMRKNVSNALKIFPFVCALQHLALLSMTYHKINLGNGNR